MAQLETRVSVDSTDKVFYTIVLTDVTYEQTYTLNVSGQISNGGSLQRAEVESEIQNFANALAATHPTIALTSITKTSVTESPLG